MAEVWRAVVGFFLLATSLACDFLVCFCIVCFHVLMNSMLTAGVTKIRGCAYYLWGAKFQDW